MPNRTMSSQINTVVLSRPTSPGHRDTRGSAACGSISARYVRPQAREADSTDVVSVLLSITFACGLVIAVAHVLNRGFVAPVYDVLANLTAFACAVGASLLLDHWIPAMLSGIAILCWLALARRTVLARRRQLDPVGTRVGDS